MEHHQNVIHSQHTPYSQQNSYLLPSRRDCSMDQYQHNANDLSHHGNASMHVQSIQQHVLKPQ